MEVGEAVFALDFVDAEFDFAEGVVFVFLQVGEGDLEDAAFEGVVGVLQAGGAVHEGFADTKASLVFNPICVRWGRGWRVVLPDVEGGGCFDVEPVFPGEWVGLLLQALLAL